jgi:hypothetical protein
MWTRTPEWRPQFTLVDGRQVDYNWIEAGDAGDFRRADSVALLGR